MISSALDFYVHEACALSSGNAILDALRLEGRHRLSAQGFPTRAQEAWKYTDTRQFLASQWAYDKTHVMPDEKINIEVIRVSMTTGVLGGELPDGLIIMTLKEAIERHPAWVKPYLNSIVSDVHGLTAQNAAMLSMGVFVYCAPGLKVDLPVYLAHHQTIQGARYFRHLVVMGEGSQLTLIEDYSGAPSLSYYMNTVTEVDLAARAVLKHYKLQRESQSAYHFGELAAVQSRDSKFESHSVAVGGCWVRSDTRTTLKGEWASCLMNGIYCTKKNQHLDHHTQVDHQVSGGVSEQHYKGLVADQSRAIFNGLIRVAPKVHGIVANQHNKNLLLASTAEVDTEPQLEIFSEDVRCTHGATVGQLDEEALFYCLTRGFSETLARAFLTRAFLEENIRLLGVLGSWMTQCLDLEA